MARFNLTSEKKATIAKLVMMYLIFVFFMSPYLVLCKGTGGHIAIELIQWECCQKKSSLFDHGRGFARDLSCEDSCSDTSIDQTFIKGRSQSNVHLHFSHLSSVPPLKTFATIFPKEKKHITSTHGRLGKSPSTRDLTTVVLLI